MTKPGDPNRPAVPCQGVTKRGEACRNWAAHGHLVCNIHGAGPRCSATANDGNPCPFPAMKDSAVCLGHDPERAAARIPGVPCKICVRKNFIKPRPAMRGQEICQIHGGMARQNKRKAQVRLAEERARRAFEKMGVTPEPVGNALEALQLLAGETLAWKAICARVVSKIEKADWRYESQQSLEQLRGEVVLFQNAMAQASTILLGLARAQIDERLARIDEAKAAIIVAALRDALKGAGVDADVAAVIRTDFSTRLRVIPGKIA